MPIRFNFNIRKLLVIVVICISVSIISTTKIWAVQKNHSPKQGAQIKLKSRPLSNKILLRWAVNHPYEWSVANQYEFIVERRTLGIIDTQTKQIINFLGKVDYEKKTYVVKMQDSSSWNKAIQKAINKNDYLVAAQALFGTSFETSNPTAKKNFATIINQAKQIEQRFAYSLMMADQNFEIAKLAGWAFEDTLIEPNKKYSYRVYNKSPLSKAKIDTSYTIASVLDYLPLPPVIGVNVKFGDRVALISWNKNILSSFYNAYFIERSEDSIHFINLNDLPLVGIDNENTRSDLIVYTDSLPSNFKKYYYRITGINSFGEIGEPSKIVFGQGKTILKYVPNIKEITVNSQNIARINWYIDPNALSELSHFQLLYGSNRDSCKLTMDSIDKEKKSLDYNLEFLSNYFIINAISNSGANRKSLVHYIQLVDSIPPVAPTEVKGAIDSHLIAHITWRPNTEKDLLGYMVLKSNLQNEEATIINKEPIQDTLFIDTLNKKLSNPKVFYYVIAFDKRMNQSDLSKALTLVKPDRIPPSAPLNKSIEMIDKRLVKISFIPSLSNDISHHFILRKITNLKNEEWNQLASIPHQDSTFMITFIDTISLGYLSKIDVEYQLVAVDKSLNQTNNIEPITISLPEVNSEQFKILSFEANSDYIQKKIILNWEFNNTNSIDAIEIFKAEDKNPYTLLKVIKAPLLNNSEDVQITRGHDYKYSIRVLFKNGNYSMFKEVKRWYE